MTLYPDGIAVEGLVSSEALDAAHRVAVHKRRRYVYVNVSERPPRPGWLVVRGRRGAVVGLIPDCLRHLVTVYPR